MSEEKIKKTAEAVQKEQPEEISQTGELSDDNLEAVSGGMSFRFGQNPSILKDDM